MNNFNECSLEMIFLRCAHNGRYFFKNYIFISMLKI